MATGEERSVKETVQDVSSDFAALVREEIALAKAELQQGFRQVVRGAVLLLIAGFIVNAGLLALVASAVLGLSGAMEAWLASMIVGLVLAVVGGVLLARGMTDVKQADLKPDRTMESLKEDARIVKERGNE